MKLDRLLTLGMTGLLCVSLTGSWVMAQDVDPVQPPTLEERIANQIERMDKRLELTDEQKVQIEGILKEKLPDIETLMDKVKEMHQEVRDAVEGVLTDEQKAPKPDFKAPPGFMGPRGFGFGQGRFGGPGLFGGPGPFGGPGFGMHRGGPGFGSPLHQLDLTEEQKEKIKEIFEAKPENPHEAIQDVLTDEQKAKLDEVRNERLSSGVFGALELTDEQKEQIKDILASKPDDPRAAIQDVLTDEQKAKLDELKDTFRGRRGPGFGHPGMGRGAGMGRGRGSVNRPGYGIRGAFRDLDLTAEQRDQIHEILKDRPENPFEAIQDVLTEEQKAKLDEIRQGIQDTDPNVGNGPQGRRPGRGVRGGGRGGPRILR